MDTKSIVWGTWTEEMEKAKPTDKSSENLKRGNSWGVQRQKEKKRKKRRRRRRRRRRRKGEAIISSRDDYNTQRRTACKATYYDNYMLFYLRQCHRVGMNHTFKVA